MDLEKEEYGPFIKQNDVPVYVDVGSNHPPKVLENIPKGINKGCLPFQHLRISSTELRQFTRLHLKKVAINFNWTLSKAKPKVMKIKNKQETGRGPSSGSTPLTLEG